MLRSCGKRLIVAVAGVAALMWVGAGCTSAQVSQGPAFARLALSEKSAVCIRIQGGEVRAAMSAEGLQTAEPVKTHTEFTLPIPADQLPAGVTAIKANLALMQIQTAASAALAPYINGTFRIFRADDQKAEWQFVSAGGGLAGANAEKAPSIKLPDPDKLDASLSATVTGEKLAVGLRVTAGGATLTDVRKDGHLAVVKMVVADASGVEIASKVGTLADFGFS
ncbi:MAG: hypothetical protein ABSA67_09375 [Candidatus Brocadiia bacterium]|jgi:hypothetical protein